METVLRARRTLNVLSPAKLPISTKEVRYPRDRMTFSSDYFISKVDTKKVEESSSKEAFGLGFCCFGHV